ncbi:MAG: type IV pilus secretin PilQ [Halofilum sp. (in: g-proteobacteria)]
MTRNRRLRPLPRTWLGALLLAACSTAGAANQADTGNALEAVDYSVLPGERIELRFDFSEPVAEPRSFTIQDPARIALDFANTRNATGQRRVELDVGAAQSLHIAEASDRTRIVLNLSESTRHSTQIDGNTLVMTLGASDSGDRTQAAESGEPFAGTQADAADSDHRAVTGVDFRRGEDGQGRIRIELADPNTPVDIQRRGNDVLVELPDTRIPESLRERLDVLDFATPVQHIDVRQRGSDGEIRITPRIADYEQLAYQSDNAVTIEVREPVEDDRERQEPTYTGERLSLNFQQIEVRAVLQLLADFTGLNIVVSDSVGGSITLRLKNVPWDQALDIVLRTQGLDKRRNGNVMFIAPSQELAAREQAELEARQQQSELAPLRTEYIQVNYAKASELASVVQSQDVSLLSDRASVTVDQRTNTLLVRGTAENLEQVRRLVSRLDVPVRQVLIESRIVVATNNFSEELGVSFGPEAVGDTVNFNNPGDSSFNVNLPASSASGSFGVAVGNLSDGTLVGLELSAMQAEGRGEVISSPRVITADQNEAEIRQGVQIPYREASSSGAATVSFQDAVLSLTVTPQITPDDRIVMDLAVTNDQIGAEILDGIPTVDTREVTTRVLVENGETVVLGGIYEETQNESVNRVPFFGDLPIVGTLFRHRVEERDKSELLVFVTPKIVRSASSAE